MDTLRKLLSALGALTLVMVLSIGPAVASETGDLVTATEATEGGEAEAGEEGAEEAEHGESLIIRNDEGKMVLPLDPNRPRDAVGWGILAVVALGLMLGLVNAVKQLRGERGQATGEWRYR